MKKQRATMEKVRHTMQEFDSSRFHNPTENSNKDFSAIIPIMTGFLLLIGFFVFSMSSFGLGEKPPVTKPPVTDKGKIVQDKIIEDFKVDMEQAFILYPEALAQNQTISLGDDKLSPRSRTVEELLESDYGQIQESYAKTDKFDKKVIHVKILDGNYQAEFD